MTYLILGFYVLLLGLMLWKVKDDAYIYYKSASSLGFIMAAVAFAFIGKTTGYLTAFLPGLCAFAAGDFLLVYVKKDLRPGIVAFALGNVFFLIWMTRMNGLDPVEFVLPCLVMIALNVIEYRKLITFGEFRTWVLVYAFLLTWAFSKTVLLWHAMPAGMTFRMMLGYGCYVLSDIFLMPVKFKSEYPKGCGLLCLIFYYGGMFVLAAALLG